MTPRQYEIAMYAQTVWRVANSSDEHELEAVACTLRNWVLPKMGQVAKYKSYSEACGDFLDAYPLRSNPTLEDLAFVHQMSGILSKIEQIYDGDTPDITATHDHPNGARYFARVQTLASEDWRKVEIVDRPGLHCLLGSFGSQQFYE